MLTPKSKLLLPSLFTVTFMTAVEATIVASMLPYLSNSIGKMNGVSWIMSSYFLGQLTCMILIGALADHFGRKKTFLGGVMMFGVASLACGLSTSLKQLILWRVFQGVGAGAVRPVINTIIGDRYAGKDRHKIQGWIGGTFLVASGVGPMLGVYFASHNGWQSVFTINFPLCIAACLLFIQSYEDAPLSESSETPRPRPFLLRHALSLGLSAIYTGLLIAVPFYAKNILNYNSLGIAISTGACALGWPIASVLCANIKLSATDEQIEFFGIKLSVLGAIFLVSLGSHHPVIFNSALLLTTIGFGLQLNAHLRILQSSVAYAERGRITSVNTFMRTAGNSLGAYLFESLSSGMR